METVNECNEQCYFYQFNVQKCCLSGVLNWCCQWFNPSILRLIFAEMLKSSSQKRTPEEQSQSKSEPSHTPLHQAAIAGDDAAVEVLLVSGVDRFAKDNKVMYTLSHLYQRKSYHSLDPFFPFFRFQHGNTALHEAAWRGYSRCVKLLCTIQQTPRSNGKKFGKKPKSVKHVEDEWKSQNYLNTANAGGFSPLHLAAQNGHNQSCREILLAGGNPDVKNNVSLQLPRCG